MPIHQKILAVMKAVKGVEKDSENKHARYRYAGHEAVTEALRSQFVEHGILRQVTVPACEVMIGGAIMITAKVSYIDVEDDSRVDLEMPALQHCQTKTKEPIAQQVGQAVSYAVKNLEFKNFCLTGDTEPDADSMMIDPGHQETHQNLGQRQNGTRAGNGHREANVTTAQGEAHQKASHIEDVLVIYGEGEQEGAATATEAAKLLAERLKNAKGWFEASAMLGANNEWVQLLPDGWQQRLEALANAKQDNGNVNRLAVAHRNNAA